MWLISLIISLYIRPPCNQWINGSHFIDIHPRDFLEQNIMSQHCGSLIWIHNQRFFAICLPSKGNFADFPARPAVHHVNVGSICKWTILFTFSSMSPAPGSPCYFCLVLMVQIPLGATFCIHAERHPRDTEQQRQAFSHTEDLSLLWIQIR